MADTKIEWATTVWNPVTGCTPVSPGCEHCYAKRMANRLRGRCGYPADDPFRVTVHKDRLTEPLRWRKPRRIFVCSMGDLFHDDVPVDLHLKLWQTMANCPQHRFLILTKRAKRMREVLREMDGYDSVENVWLGVSAENQQTADERIPDLLATPAAVRFVSAEPLLGPLDLRHIRSGPDRPSYHCRETIWHPEGNALERRRSEGGGEAVPTAASWPGLDWVIAGGESGPGARPMDPDWARSIRDQCQAAGVPFFHKQNGEWAAWGGLSWPKSLDLNCDEADKRYASTSIGPTVFYRVGKKAAGRVLDGRTWDEMPERTDHA